jgi:hypothetical protein
MDSSERSERYMTAGELASVTGIPAHVIVRFHAEGRLNGRRMPGTLSAVQVRASDVEAVWDLMNQLVLAENVLADSEAA